MSDALSGFLIDVLRGSADMKNILSFLCSLLFLPVVLQAQLAEDPATLPIPDFRHEQYERAIALVVSVEAGEDGAPAIVTVLDTVITSRRSGLTIANPPLISLSLYDAEGNMLSQHQDWNPLIERDLDEDGTETQSYVSQSTGTFFLPLTRELAKVGIRDLEAEVLLKEVDVKAIVDDYCESNSELVACGGVGPQPSSSPSASPTPAISPTPTPTVTPEPSVAPSLTPSSTPDLECDESVTVVEKLVVKLKKQLRRIRYGRVSRKVRKRFVRSLKKFQVASKTEAVQVVVANEFSVDASKLLKRTLRIASRKSKTARRYKKLKKKAQRQLVDFSQTVIEKCRGV